MKVCLHSPLMNLENQPLMQDGAPLTLKKVCIFALVNNDAGDGQTKFNRWTLAQKLQAFVSSDDIDLTPEEVSTLRECIGKIYLPMVVGPAFKLLS